MTEEQKINLQIINIAIDSVLEKLIEDLDSFITDSIVMDDYSAGQVDAYKYIKDLIQQYR